MTGISLIIDNEPSAHGNAKIDPTLTLDAGSVPKFISPSLPVQNQRNLSDGSIPEPIRSLHRFGVCLEDFSAEILNEVTRDILSLLGSLPPTSRLVIVSPNSGDVWEKLSKVLPIDIQMGGFDSVKIWKAYWKNEKPDPPEGIRFSYEKKVGNSGIRRLNMRVARDTSFLPPNPDENRFLPPGNSPSSLTRKPSSNAPAQMTPQLYMWSAMNKIPIVSSRHPKVGDHVLSLNDRVEVIKRIEGGFVVFKAGHGPETQYPVSSLAWSAAFGVWAPYQQKVTK